MMTLKIQIIIAVMIAIFVAVLFVMTVKKSIQPKYSDAIGIFSPVNMIFFVGFLYMGFIIFALSVALSRMSGRVTSLTQEMAILRKEIEDKEEESK